MFRSLAVWAGVALSAVAGAQQVAFGVGASMRPVGAALNLPGNVSTRSLASVTSQDAFLALSHPKFPAHQVRIKKSEFCDPTVK